MVNNQPSGTLHRYLYISFMSDIHHLTMVPFDRFTIQNISTYNTVSIISVSPDQIRTNDEDFRAQNMFHINCQLIHEITFDKRQLLDVRILCG